MRYLFIALISIGLSGCALPVPLQIASFAASGLSYISTGKSMSDHAVSAITSRDCAVHRIVLGGSMCEAFDDGVAGVAVAQDDAAPRDSATQRLRDSMISLAEQMDGDMQPASGPEIAETAATEEPVANALVAMAETINSIQQAGQPEDRAIPDAPANARHYLIIGQFRQIQEAEAVRSRHSSLPTAVRMILNDGALLFQVTAGPFSRPDALDIGATIGATETPPEIALLCADRATRAPCGHPSGYAAVQLTLHPDAKK